MEPGRVPRFGGDPTRDDAADVLADNRALMRELLVEVRALREKKPTGGDGNGNGTRARVISALIGVATVASLGAHGLLWLHDKTIANQQTLIDRVIADVRKHEVDTDRALEGLDARIRDLERGRDR